MDEKFLKAVKAYLNIVEDACNLLTNYIEKEVKISILNKYDLYDFLHESHKYEFFIEGRKFYFHGMGCTVFGEDASIIDWDFGYRSWWCGIQPFKMSKTLKSFLFEEVEYHDANFIKHKCEQYLQESSMYCYKGQYYIDLIKLRSKKIEFPVDYSRIDIEYKGITKTFCKSRSIEKFIRKSNIIYEGILELKNNYALIFYKDENEIARIPYNDIAYPDSAVKIMNEEIIKPHIVQGWKDGRK